jgi:hypothetical protein
LNNFRLQKFSSLNTKFGEKLSQTLVDHFTLLSSLSSPFFPATRRRASAARRRRVAPVICAGRELINGLVKSTKSRKIVSLLEKISYFYQSL